MLSWSHQEKPLKELDWLIGYKKQQAKGTGQGFPPCLSSSSEEAFATQQVSGSTSKLSAVCGVFLEHREAMVCCSTYITKQ